MSGEPFQGPCAVTEAFFLDAHAMKDGEVEVTERRLCSGAHTTSGAQRPLPFASESDGKILFQVTISALDAASEHHHGIVEQRCSAFIQALEPLQKIRDLLDMPGHGGLVLFLA